MFSIACKIGRLVESRTESLADAPDVDRFGLAFRDVVIRLETKVIICGDYRGLKALAPDVAEKLTNLLTRSNPRIERLAVLLAPDQAAAGLHIEQMMREAANPTRRTFRDPVELRAWLKDALSDREQERLGDFLDEKLVKA